MLLFGISVATNAQIISDDSYLDESFWVFKEKLIATIVDKDTNQLKPFLADTILESNDGCGYPGCSKEEFIRYYFSEHDKLSTWEEMSEIIRFGFIRTEEAFPNYLESREKLVFRAPSFMFKHNSRTELVVLGERVNIRAGAGKDKDVIRQATYEVLQCDCDISTETDTTFIEVDGIWWIEVKLSDGKRGYIASKYTSIELIKEMTIAKINGVWKIISYFNEPGC